MARLILAHVHSAILVISQWEFDQILALNAEAARIMDEEMMQAEDTALVLPHEKRTWRSDRADHCRRKGLSELLGQRIFNEMVDRTVHIVVDKAPPGVNMAYDA